MFSATASPALLRREIAQAIAGLIVHDLTPWQTAREKILAEYPKLPAGAVPDSAEIESAVRETWAVFAPEAHRVLLNNRRTSAYHLMTELFSELDVMLTGAVLNGAATPETNIRLEIFTDDVKEAELRLLNRGIEFDVLDTIDSRMPAPLEVLAFLDPGRSRRDPVGVIVEIHSPRSRGRNPYKNTPDAWQEAWEASGRINAINLKKQLN